MSNLAEKSNQSYQAAVLLLSKEYYCSSLQCSYFSCLQSAKNLIIESGVNLDEFERRTRENGSHNIIIEETFNIIENSGLRGATFVDLMNSIKRWRKAAVYGLEITLPDTANSAIDRCNTIRNAVNDSLKRI